jgi:hypothetical protein
MEKVNKLMNIFFLSQEKIMIMGSDYGIMGSGMLFVIVVMSDLNSNFSSIRNIFGK